MTCSKSSSEPANRSEPMLAPFSQAGLRSAYMRSQSPLCERLHFAASSATEVLRSFFPASVFSTLSFLPRIPLRMLTMNRSLSFSLTYLLAR